MNIQLYQVDSFTNESFKGNPAGVCILAQPASENWMQKIAMEMNLSETAFAYPQDNGYRLRWFTPIAEVELCGHATLATAHILFETGILKPDQTAQFYTQSGLLTVTYKQGLLEMNFPAIPASPCILSEKLKNALGIKRLIWSGKNDTDYLIELASEKEIIALQPNFGQLKNISRRGVIVTARSDNPEFHFISRFFAPAVGIDEDPVTGSAHCTLGPYWSEKMKKTKFNAYQASRRGGTLTVEITDDRVLLKGEAVTVFKCEMI